MDSELLAYLDRRFAETNQSIAELREETSRRFDEVDQRVGALETQGSGLVTDLRHTRVLIEDVQSKVQLMAEGIATVDEKVDRVQAHLEEQAKQTIAPVRLAVGDHRRRLDDHERRLVRLERPTL